ncbi:MAG: sugar transferase [Verrucomicrobiota bacterium]|nr:sugar transferase [Verrucomicrobiota bacterium]
MGRNGNSTAPDLVSRMLASAVLERVAHDRAIPEGAPNESSRYSADGDSEAESTSPAETRSAHPAIPFWKRTLDCTLIVLSSPVWLPVMLLIMLGVKLSSQGPILYRQERVGYRGRRFMIFKFRTMKMNVETHVHESYFERLMQSDTPMTKLDANGDPRLIRAGRLLRASGLDELPQLFNILRGDMSLVGPRPCTVHEFGRYQPWQRERVNAPPGLTGYWQVNGKNKTTFSEMIAMDIFYAQNMTLALDLKILAKTIPAVFSQVTETRGHSWTRFLAVPRVVVPRHD